MKEDTIHDKRKAASQQHHEGQRKKHSGEDLGRQNSFNILSIVQERADSSRADQHKRHLAYPKCEQKKIMKEAGASAKGANTNNGNQEVDNVPTPHHEKYQMLSLECAEEGMNKREDKRKASQKPYAGQKIKRNREDLGCS